MARVETVEIDIPYEAYRMYRDAVMQDLGKRDFMSNANNFADNDSVAESLLANAILPYLGEQLEGTPHVEPTEEGTLEVVRETDDDGNFTPTKK